MAAVVKSILFFSHTDLILEINSTNKKSPKGVNRTRRQCVSAILVLGPSLYFKVSWKTRNPEFRRNSGFLVFQLTFTLITKRETTIFCILNNLLYLRLLGR